MKYLIYFMLGVNIV